MVKKSENPRKSQKISKIHFFYFKKKFSPQKRKQKMLSSLFSNIRRKRFYQSSPVQPVSEIQKSRTIFKKKPFFFNEKNCEKIKFCQKKREKNAILLVFQY